MTQILLSIGLILVGLWIADFATGLFHWVVDNYCNPKWPIIGPYYIEPSHLHHDEDMYEFELSTLVTHLYIWSMVVFVGLVFWMLGLMNIAVASACCFGFLTNIIHGWAHTRAEDNFAIVRLLQRFGIFQSTMHHNFHHLEGSESHYCLLTNHVNPVLEMAGLWRILDRVFSRLGIEKYWWEADEKAKD